MTEDEKYMKAAIRQARLAAKDGDVPVGCVIVRDGVIIARARNEREKKRNALCHAELTAISRACKRLGGWRLINCALYVTLEPCPMCAAAIREARIERVVYGAPAVYSDGRRSPQTAPAPAVTGGVSEAECAALVKDFCKSIRKAPKLSNN